MIIRLKSTIDMRTENTSATAAYVIEIYIFSIFGCCLRSTFRDRKITDFLGKKRFRRTGGCSDRRWLVGADIQPDLSPVKDRR